MGQRWLTLSGKRIIGTTPDLEIRKRRLEFVVYLSQRVRDQPNDRLGEIAYLESLADGTKSAMAAVIEYCIEYIESETFTALFKTELDTIPIPPTATTPPYDPSSPPAGLPPKYQLSDAFQFLDANLDPVHLYPSDFLTRAGNDKEELYAKIAGYRMSATFNTPEYQETYSRINCRKYDLSGGGGSSSP